MRSPALLAALLAGCWRRERAVPPEPRTAATTTPEATTAPASTPDVAPARMIEAAFWTLIDETHEAAGGDTERQSGLLDERLTQLPAQQIADFGGSGGPWSSGPKRRTREARRTRWTTAASPTSGRASA